MLEHVRHWSTWLGIRCLAALVKPDLHLHRASTWGFRIVCTVDGTRIRGHVDAVGAAAVIRRGPIHSITARVTRCTARPNTRAPNVERGSRRAEVVLLS